jgi:hypothetical protein
LIKIYRDALHHEAVAKLGSYARTSLHKKMELHLAKKAKTRRQWTATEVHKLKGLAKKRLGVDKIARTLKLTVAATAVKASALGVSLAT